VSDVCQTTLGEISTIRTGKLDANAQSENGQFPFFTCGDETLRIDVAAFDTEAVLLAGNGNFGVKYYKGKFNAYQRTYVIEPRNIDGKWLYYLVSHHIKKITKGSRGSTIQYLRLGDIADCPVELPPLAEQKRIVAKIEELFSELEAGEASLRKARRQLGVYRQALLKQAFEGKLTQKWRTQNPDKLESAVQLLARIQSERQSRYDKQLKGWELGGKAEARPRKPKDFETISVEDLSSLSSRPHGWAWVRFGNLLAISSGNGLTAHQRQEGPYPVYGGNGISGYHNAFMFQVPQLVIGRVGAKCGITHITAPNSWVTDNALVCEFQIESINMEFGRLLLNYFDLNKLSVSTAQPVVSGSKLNPLPLPLCSLPEQQQIVRLLDEQFEAIERNERELDAALKRSEALRQSILKKAFAGRLVPQDPADEPAAALLSRLRAERETVVATHGRSSKKRTASQLSGSPA
jgi:type I restriction enzyme S subunit